MDNIPEPWVDDPILNVTITTSNFNKGPKASSIFDENQTWVQCESPSCLKWRLVSKVDSGGVELNMEQAWFCTMNPDPAYSSCSVPQDHIPAASVFKKHGFKIVFSLLPVGSLVLAKARRWPWWPAILSPDPDSGEYASLDRDGHLESYHVEYLGKRHSRYWASVQCVESYRPITVKELRAVKATTRKSYDFAIQEATKISDMPCEERLQLCHFQTHDLLFDAQKMMDAIERMIYFQYVGSSSQERHSREERQQVCQGSVEEGGDVLIIEGLRFESATSREGLRRLRSQPSAAGGPEQCVTPSHKVNSVK